MRNFTRCLQVVGFAACISMTASCALLPRPMGAKTSTRGEVSNGRYTSPLRNFSLPLPALGLGSKVQDGNDDDGGAVSFHDDFGNLKRIDYLRLPPDFTSVQADPVKRDAAYRGFLHDFLLPVLFQPAFPKTKVLHEELVNEGEQRAYFAVLWIPEGSNIAKVVFPEGSTSYVLEREDTTRALLIFSEGDFMYALSHATGIEPKFDRHRPAPDSLDTERGGLSGEESGVGPLEERLESFQEILQRFRSTINFGPRTKPKPAKK